MLPIFFLIIPNPMVHFLHIKSTLEFPQECPHNSYSISHITLLFKHSISPQYFSLHAHHLRKRVTENE